MAGRSLEGIRAGTRGGVRLSLSSREERIVRLVLFVILLLLIAAVVTAGIPGPSIPLDPSGRDALSVASTEGRLHQLTAATGTGTAAIGNSSLDDLEGPAHAGSEAGVVQGVQVPLP